MRQVYLNKAYIPESEAKISAFDRGFLYGEGLFETIRVYNTKPFAIEDHLARMNESARFLGLSVPDIDFKAILTELSIKNSLPDAYARITLSPGELPRGPRPGHGGEPTVLINVAPLPPTLEEKAQNGVRGKTLPWPLRASGIPLSQHKTLNYLASILALKEVRDDEEPILETTDNLICEGASTNIFMVCGGKLCTPSAKTMQLPGITRNIILELAKDLGLEPCEGDFNRNDLANCDEAFVSNSIIQIVPLVSLDDAPLGTGQPGHLTRKFQAEFQNYVEANLVGLGCIR